MALPQAYEIWINQQVAGVSIYTWSFFLLAAVVWLFYGLKVKDKPLIITSTLWIIVESIIVAGLIVY